MTFPSTPTAHLVQQSTDTNGFTSSSIDTSGASLLVVCVSWYTGSGGGAVLSDSKSNTWTGLTSKSPAGGVAGSNRLYYAVNPTVGAGHTFTITGTASFPAIAVQAWASADTSSPFDVENGNGTDFDVTFKSIKTGSITPGSNDELVVAGFGNVNAVGTLSIDSSLTISDSGDRIANGIGVGMAYIVQTSAGAVNPLWSFTTANDNTTALIASFKSASASGITTAIASTETGDTFAGSAAVTLPTSTIAATETGDTIAASVTVTQPALSIAATEADDSFLAQAVVVGGTLTSDIVVTETGDSMAGVLVGVSTKQGGDDVPRGKSPDRGFDLKAWQKKQRVYDDIEITARDTYQALTGTAKEKAAVVLEKHVQNNQPKATEIPLEVAIDWVAASKDLEARASLREMLRLQDEEKMIVEWLFND